MLDPMVKPRFLPDTVQYFGRIVSYKWPVNTAKGCNLLAHFNQRIQENMRLGLRHKLRYDSVTRRG